MATKLKCLNLIVCFVKECLFLPHYGREGVYSHSLHDILLRLAKQENAPEVEQGDDDDFVPNKPADWWKKSKSRKNGSSRKEAVTQKRQRSKQQGSEATVKQESKGAAKPEVKATPEVIDLTASIGALAVAARAMPRRQSLP